MQRVGSDEIGNNTHRRWRLVRLELLDVEVLNEVWSVPNNPKNSPTSTATSEIQTARGQRPQTVPRQSIHAPFRAIAEVENAHERETARA